MAQKALYDLTLKISANSAELSKGIKDANAKMDSFQQNVAGQMKKVQGAFIAAAAVIGTLKGTLETVKKGMNETGEGADKLEKFTIKLKEGFDSLAASIVKADFANMIQNWKNATRAAGDYADKMDLVNDRLSDLSVRRAAVASSVATLRVKKEEGTITKAEVEELKQNTELLLEIETEIYQSAYEAARNKIAETRGVSADLFTNLEAGINARALLRGEELDGLDKYITDYDAKLKEITSLNTKIEYFNPGGDSMPVAISRTDSVAVNKAMEEYIANLDEIGKLMIFQQKLAPDDEYKQMIEFLIKRNNLEGEYAGLLRRTISAGKAVKDESGITRVAGIDKIDTSNISIPDLYSTPEQLLKVKKPAQTFAESWEDAAMRTGTALNSIANEFSNLADIIQSSMEDGSVSFRESMSIMASAAMSAIGIIQALAIAGLFAKEATSKGLIGVFAALAGVAIIAGTISSFKGRKMADGGLVYGSSIVNVGEYAGAKTNPEVIAPLSKLQNIIGGNLGRELRVTGELIARGDVLVAVINGQQRKNNSYR